MNRNPTDPVGPTDVVAIDGPSGAGKSTIAKALAKALRCQYLDTGAMYRAVTWHFLQLACAPAEAEGPEGDRCRQEALEHTELRLQGEGRVLVNGRDVTSHLRSREVESQVSAVSALPFVRQAMRALQRRVAEHGPVVAEGRDMGSVVFPDARWKLYLDAAPAERARRRLQDFLQRGRVVSEQEVLEEIEVRDHLDSTRKDAPLLRAAGAHYLDTTGMTTDQVVQAVLRWMGKDGDEAKGRA